MAEKSLVLIAHLLDSLAHGRCHRKGPADESLKT
jgi:hypothetical protein